jgi:hypothetical protein
MKGMFGREKIINKNIFRFRRTLMRCEYRLELTFSKNIIEVAFHVRCIAMLATFPSEPNS